MKKFLFFFLIFIFIHTGITFAKDEVKFNADTLRFSFSSGLLIGKGHVVFSFKNLKLFADYAEIDAKNKNIFAKGNVKIFIFQKNGKTQEIKGKAAYYDWNENYFFMDNMQINLGGGKLKGILYVKGDVLEYKKFKEQEMKVVNGTLTTCKKCPPAYHFEAKKIMIIPGKRIYAWNVAWYEGKTKIFTYPYFIIFLDRKYQLPYVPKVGYSKTDGFFLKNTFNYFVDPYSWGSVYLDWYSKKGVGYGVRHEWDEDDYTASLSLYYFKYKADQDRNFKTSISLSDWYVGDFSGNFTLSYKTEGDLEESVKTLEGTLSLSGGKNFPLKLKFSYKGSGVTAHDTEKFTGELSYKDKIFDKKGSINLNLKYKNTTSSSGANPTLSGTLKLTYKEHSLNLSYKGSDNKLSTNTQKYIYTYTHKFSKELKNTFKLRYESHNEESFGFANTFMNLEDTISYKDFSIYFSKYFDTDGILYEDDDHPSFVNKLPEIKYAPPAKKIGSTRVKYKYTLIAGNYEDLKEDVYGQKYGGKLDLSGDIKVGKDFKLSYLIFGENYFYSTKDTISSYGGDLKLRGNIAPKVTWEVSFKQRNVDGESPFSFDDISSYKTLTTSLKIREQDLKLSISGGYDYLSKKYKKIAGTLVYEPSNNFKGSFKFGYDLNDGKWTKLTGNVTLKFAENWKVEYQGTLSTSDNRIVDNKVILTYSLPCERELSISYDQKKEEYWLQYNILAFPSPLISFGSGK